MRRRADGRARFRPPRRPVRPARDPRGGLRAGPAPRGRDRRLRGAADGRLRRCAGRAGRPGALPPRDRGDRRQVLGAGAIPIVLGGDHSIAEPDMRACARVHGPGRARPLRHAHGHRHRGLRRRGLARHADVPARRGGRDRAAPLRADRPARLLAGRAGVRLAARRRHHELLHARRRDARASRRSSSGHWTWSGEGPVFLSVDVDVLDPAFAPGTGTPEPGGMTSADLLWAVRTSPQGSSSSAPTWSRYARPRSARPTSTALVADRTVREIMTGIALRKRERSEPQDPPGEEDRRPRVDRDRDDAPRGAALPAAARVRRAGERAAGHLRRAIRTSSGSARARERVTWFEPFTRAERVGAAVREVVHRRQAQHHLQLRRPPRRGGLGDKVAYYWEGEPVDERRELTFADLQRETTKLANALKAARRDEGDAGRDLHGHGPGDADRDARLRADRRAAHRRLRRLLRRLALRPPAGHGLRGADHAGRGMAPRHDRPAQEDGGRGAGRRTLGEERRSFCAAPAATCRCRTAATTGGTRSPPTRASAPASRWTPRTCSTSSTRAAPRRSRRGSCTRRPATSSASPTTHYYIFDIKPDSVYWCAADVGWVTGHSYIVYGPLCNGTTGVMYEGTPDFPDKDRWWDDRRALQGRHPLHGADRDSRAHEVGAGVRAAARPLVAAPARLGRRADQPGGLGLVPRAHRRRPLPDRRHVVADRDGDDHDHAAPGDHDDEARLGDEAVPGRRRRRLQRAGRRGGAGRRRLPRAAAAVAGDAARPLPGGRALPRDLLVEVPRTCTSPATARASTRTATSGCSAASTT